MMRKKNIGFTIPGGDGEGYQSTHTVFDEVLPITYDTNYIPPPVQMQPGTIDVNEKRPIDTYYPQEVTNNADGNGGILDIPQAPVPIVYATAGDGVIYDTEIPPKVLQLPPVVCTDCNNVTTTAAETVKKFPLWLWLVIGFGAIKILK